VELAGGEYQPEFEIDRRRRDSRAGSCGPINTTKQEVP
jgi:hypothetical protein